MRVLVTGGYGLIGSAILARLQREGHSLVGAGRSIEQAQRRFPYARWVEADFRKLTSADAWGPLLDDVDAVVNCVGVLQDSGRDDTRRVHVQATCALFDACERAMTRRVVHLSAIGAELAAATKFARTKAEADAHLASLDLDWVILRPALVMSPAVYGGSAMLRGLAAFPLMTPVIRAESRIQVVSIDDVAETVAFALKRGAPAKVRWELAHPQILTLGEIITRIRAWSGFRPRPLVHVTTIAGKIVSAVADGLGWLGWRSPARSTALAQLAAGVVGEPKAWMAATGITPQSFDQFLAAHPATVQDRWFARLYLIKPIAIARARADLDRARGVRSRGDRRQRAARDLSAGRAQPDLPRRAAARIRARARRSRPLDRAARADRDDRAVGAALVAVRGRPVVHVLDTLVAVAVNILPPALVLAILDDR